MIKETFTLFLSHQQQTLNNEESISFNNRSNGQILNEQQLETHAAEVIQVNY